VPFLRNDHASGRTYTLPDRTTVPSVTSILNVVAKPFLVDWAAREERELVCGQAAKLHVVSIPSSADSGAELRFYQRLKATLPEKHAHETIKNTAAGIGSNVHHLIEWTLRTEMGIPAGAQPVLEGTPAVRSFAAWEAWRKSISLRPVLIEQTVFSRTHGYAGTMDLLAELNLPALGRTLAILDWKTSKSLHPEYDLQTAAYRKAVTEMGHAPAGIPGVIVRLGKTDGSFEVRTLSPFEMARSFDVFLHALALFRWLHPTPAASVLPTKTSRPAKGAEFSFAS